MVSHFKLETANFSDLLSDIMASNAADRIPLNFEMLHSNSINMSDYLSSYSVHFLNLQSINPLLLDRWIRNVAEPVDVLNVQEGITLVGEGYRFSKGVLLKNFPTWPKYLDTILDNEFYISESNFILFDSEAIAHDCIFHIFHPHMRIFGHFLLEGFYKILLVDFLQRSGFEVPLYVNDCSSWYIKEYCRIVNPDLWMVNVPINTSVIAKKVIDFEINPMYVFSPFVIKLIQDFSRKHVQPGGPNKIFVSRKGVISLTGQRICDDQEALERIALSNGFEVINPSDFSVAEQVAMFAGASAVVGEYGSGIHNAIFCKPRTKIIALNHFNEVQQAIARNFCHDLTFLMPNVKKVNKDINESSALGVSFDLNLFEDCIKNIPD